MSEQEIQPHVPETTVNDEPTLQEIEQERNLSKRVFGAISIDRLAAQDPDRVVKVMENRMRALESIRLGAVRATEPHDWTLNRDKEGHVIGTLRKSGCVKVRKYFGISTINIRPQEVVIKRSSEPDGGYTAEIFGDGICGLTGEQIVNVRGARGSKEEFVGRQTESDLKEAARSNLESKITRILAGMTAVSESELRQSWANTPKQVEHCYHGHGYGKSSERQSAAPSGGVATDQLRSALKAVATITGKTEQDLLKEATVYTSKKDGKRYCVDSLERLKFDWQIENALANLKIKYPEAAVPSPSSASSAGLAVGDIFGKEEV